MKIAQANFCDLPAILDELQIDAVDAVLLDLGLSSDQLADEQRGFSFDAAGPLDLRFNPDEGESAAELLARLPERELADLIYQFGEERFSRRIARRIVEQRGERPIRTAAELAQLVRRCVPRSADRIDPATRTFQALRIAVNRELESLDLALDTNSRPSQARRPTRDHQLSLARRPPRQRGLSQRSAPEAADQKTDSPHRRRNASQSPQPQRQAPRRPAHHAPISLTTRYLSF